MTTNLNTLLRGTEVMRDSDGRVVVQSIRNMELAFLTVSDRLFSRDEQFANPFTALTASNRHYGHVQLRNNADKDVIFAPQISVMTRTSSQDHALPKSAYIPSRQAVDYDDAGCVQGSVGGHLRGDSNFRFVPLVIREQLLLEANHTGEYSHLYHTIENLGKRTRVSTGAYLERYFDHYEVQLQEFIAHFERPKDCIGVIVMVDGEIVAIDKFPSFTYCAQVWDLLVRDCYGSVAIVSMANNRSAAQEFTQVLGETNGDLTGVARLRKALRAVFDNRSVRVVERLQDLMLVEFQEERDINSDDRHYESHIMKAEGYIGQAIRTGEYNHLVSIAKRDAFDPEQWRKAHTAVREYRELAAQQRDFTI